MVLHTSIKYMWNYILSIATPGFKVYGKVSWLHTKLSVMYSGGSQGQSLMLKCDVEYLYYISINIIYKFPLYRR